MKFGAGQTEGCVSQLARRGLSVDDLPSYARPLDDDECLLLVGSIAEGLGNPHSDVDLLLIGKTKAFQDAGLTGVAYHLDAARPAPHIKVNTETYDPADLLRLQPTMSAAVAALEGDDPVDRPALISDARDVKLLHRLRSGIPLAHPEVVDLWRGRLHLDLLPELVAIGALVTHYSRREDGLSHVEEGDLDAASICLQESAAHVAGCLLATVGETNPAPRWRLKLLRRHEEGLGSPIVESLVAAMLDRMTRRDEVDALVVLFDRVVLETLSRLPRVGKVAIQIAARFPVHNRLDAR